MSAQRLDRLAVATVGFAGRADGAGVAYAALRGTLESEHRILRVTFTCRPLPALLERDVAYAAVDAVASELVRQGVSRVCLRVDDENIVWDVVERRSVPAALAVPYVRLGCTLNRFRDVKLVYGADRVSRDLTARARAEALLDIAA